MNKPNGNNIITRIYQVASERPDKIAFIGRKSITYHDFVKRIDAYAVNFQNIGVKQHSKVLVLIKPGADLFAIVYALLRLAAVPVFIDTGMGISNMLQSLRSIKLDYFIGIPISHLIRLINPQLFKGCQSIVLSKGKFHLGIPRRKNTDLNSSLPIIKSKPTDLASIVFTSGSTGPPKAVCYTNKMLEAQVNILISHFKYNSRDIDCCTFALVGLLEMSIGLTLSFTKMDMTRPGSLKSQNLIKTINENKCTHLFCSPLIIKKLVDFAEIKQFELPSLKRVITAGAFVEPVLIEKFCKRLSNDCSVHAVYGATEALPLTEIDDQKMIELIDEVNALKGVCVGKVLQGVEVQIIAISDEKFNSWHNVDLKGINEIGEIVVRGEVVSQQYLSADEYLTSKVWDEEKKLYWHRMGDVGLVDENGYLWMFGRKSHIVYDQNAMLFPIPIERVFNRHPVVNRTALIQARSKEGNNMPLLCVECRKELSAKQFEFFKEELKKIAKHSKLKVRCFEQVKYMPMDARHQAKIQREKLARKYQSYQP
ncbi:AMP-binding protein [Carboxylicivirga linearis]|uniref:AMP-binding protein n=1 Tax=Carboxylicivirga linearis TaxID=1628157 RepID=A0ABS5JTX8_9BACT|nr:AMP-binding protein [Carboxylicivirga linearis]MBS2098273.1 AMP-binding protein [Carboxylicivirga linearis]